MRTKHLFITFTAVALCFSGILSVSGCKKSESQKYTVKLNPQKDTVAVGKTVELTATVSPSDGANAVWTSGDEKVAKVTGSALNGTVTGIGEGETCIYCIVNGQFKDSCEVTVMPVYPEAPDEPCVLIGDTWWAPVNCGYDSANYKYGKLYQFGRAKGCGYNDTWKGGGPETEIQTYCDSPATTDAPLDDKFYQGDTTNYDWFSGAVKLGEWPMESGDAGYKAGKIDNPCPTGWRVPTDEELSELIGSHKRGLMQDGTGVHSGMKGKWFDGSMESEPSSGVFLPAAGIRCSFDGGVAINRVSFGDYWSSSVNDSCAWYLRFDNGGACMYDNWRAYGFSVRCVYDSK